MRNNAQKYAAKMSQLLSHEDTLRLLNLAQNGDEDARESLVVHNIALVKSLVRGFMNRGVDYDDLIQIGSMGLLKAIDGYQSQFGVRFSTYAVPMITGEIKRFLRDDGIIKVSRSLKENAIRIYRAEELLKRKLGREPTIEELSNDTGISSEDIVHSMEAIREPMSIYEPIYGDEKTLLVDTIARQDDSEMIGNLILKDLLSSLNERERNVIVLRYFRDRTQSEIAKIIGVSQVQVSRIIVRTLEKLRKAGCDEW